MYPAGNLFIPAAHGRLEAILKGPGGAAAARGAALVLHPHPLHGGTMHNKVVFRAARALQEAGCVALRLPSRGSLMIASSCPCSTGMKRLPTGYIRSGGGGQGLGDGVRK